MSLEYHNKILFFDQIKVILYQTPRKAWFKKNEMVDYDGREEKAYYSVNVISSFDRVEAISIVVGDVKTEDVVYFLESYLICQLYADIRVKVLLDQASWHLPHLCKSSLAFEFLVINIAQDLTSTLLSSYLAMSEPSGDSEKKQQHSQRYTRDSKDNPKRERCKKVTCIKSKD